MKYYTAFLRKELMEYARTYKLLIMLVIFLVFGLMSPVSAKLLPDILSEFMPEGISIAIGEPTAMDSWNQFFKNISQTGIVVSIIVFSGMLSSELSKGSLVIMLTKGLPRKTVILAKFTAAATVWTVSYIAATSVALGYTAVLFRSGDIHNLMSSLICLWIFGVFILAVQLFSATLTSSNIGCLLITGGIALALMLIDIVPAAQKYNPLSMATDYMPLLSGTLEVSDMLCAGAITILASFILMMLSLLRFRKRQI